MPATGVSQITELTRLYRSRALNRLKYRSGLGSGSANFMLSGLPPVQVFRRLILQIQFRLKLKTL